MDDLKQQLAPGWSTVNIVILVLLFMFSWVMALIFLAYVLGGHKVNLDLSRPESIAAFGKRLSAAFKAGIDSFSKG
ncbi:MAG: hypothetical protein AB8B84_12455 [Granulosicoccus sp.]